MLRRWSTLLVNGYGLMLGMYVLLRAARGERSHYVELLNHSMPGLALPTLPLFLLALLRRDRVRAVYMLLPILALLLQYNTRHSRSKARSAVTPRLNSDADQTGKGDVIKLLTFNMQGERARLPHLIELIRSFKPDILCFQELTEPAARALSEALGEDYPHQQIYTQGITIHGVGTYSRYPLNEREFIPADHGHLRAIVTPNGATNHDFVLYNVHPSPPGGLRNLRGFQPRYRRDEIDVILAHTENEKLPIVMVGDFNLTDRTADYYQITAHFDDAFREAGFGPRATFPDLGGIARPLGGPWFGLLRLDYVFHSHEIQALNVRVIPDAAGSDHRPVLAQLAFDHI